MLFPPHFIKFGLLHSRLMQILRHYPLRQLHTFQMDVYAEEYAGINMDEDLIQFLEEYPDKLRQSLVLGGGSNVLFSKDYPGVILHMNIRGREVLERCDGKVLVNARAGEDWDGLVNWCTTHGYYGLENLSGIPGSVGACPIQNIGAYGVEVRDWIEEVEVLDLARREKILMRGKDCRFGYRDSIFKQKLKNKVIILAVRFRLSEEPVINLSYAGLKERFEGKPLQDVSPARVREEVLAIRAMKLPDPKLVGNAGSFFKNPVVREEQYQELSGRFPGIPYFNADQGRVKLPAGWLIDQCGWKGFRRDDAGVWERQALVLCNFGKASPEEMLRLAGEIRQSVGDTFGIWLETEVNIV